MKWIEIESREYMRLHKENAPLTLVDKPKEIVYKKDTKPIIKATSLLSKYPKYWKNSELE